MQDRLMYRVGYVPFATIVVTVCGCAFSDKPGPDVLTLAAEAQQPLGASLFPADQAVISNEAVEQLLTSKVTLPQHARVAVMQFGRNRPPPWWSDEVARMDLETVEQLLDHLRQSKRIASAMFVPGILVPDRQTIPYLREVAARCQANLLLIYRVAYSRYEKSKVLSPDQVKAYCVVEAALLETRTGTVPFTSVSMHDYSAAQSREDLNLAETMRKAEMKALGEALDKVAADVVKFVDSIE